MRQVRDFKIRGKFFGNGDKPELPSDIYDAAACEGTLPDFAVRGTYNYDTAKIFAQSGFVDALTFEAVSGEIKTSSPSTFRRYRKFFIKSGIFFADGK